MAKWVCPECRARFPFVAGKEPECPECGYSIPSKSDDGIVMPFISHARHKNPDVIYKAEEQASRHRAEVAAEIAGASVSDMSAMMITNQRDNLRPGEVTAPKITADNQVARAMSAAPANPQTAPLVGNAGNAAGLYFSSQVGSGPLPNMGARIQQRIREHHPGALKTDAPANEVSSPNYRPRV